MSGLRLCHQGHSNSLSSRYCNQCGAPLMDGEDTIERIVGDRYRILRDIGHGGFGKTYLAEDINRFNERCVLKELAPIADNKDSLEKAKELFSREAEVLYKLKHPQIPKFREWFVESTRESMFLVQDYVEGPTYQDILHDRQNQSLTFSEPEVVTLLMQLLPVLSYIHGRGVVHRDLSPDNLICRNRDRLPVLIDFGGVKEVTVSALRSQTPTQASKQNVTLIGKPGYSPEEQMRRGQVTAASDLYALGATALVLLIGKEPAEFYDAFHLKFDWQDKVKVSAGLTAILEKMVAHREADRYGTAEQVLQDLTNLSPGGVQNGTATPQPNWTAAPKPNPLQTEGSLKTLVVAPLGTETVVATEPAIPKQSSPPKAAVGAVKRIPGVIGKGAAGLLRSLLVLLLLAGAGGLGWMGVRWWLQYQVINPLVNRQPTPQQTKGYSSNEKQRKAQLFNRLERSGVSSSFFYRVTNEAYYLQYPDQRGHLLSNGPKDEPLRANWDRVGTQVLDLSEQLSPAARDRLGKYTAHDR
ncbi:MAG: serine/threonine protein kinase, partial [Acaryochloridaceae cyanobacterium RU_4_10]|nr:serine/threonine protein kinase [Acaryochloridaceae cyanobacterium RU_4_10]